MKNWLDANWPAPDWLHAGTTTRLHGTSQAPYDSLNLALHVADSETDVLKNRQMVSNSLDLPAQPVWLNQIHSNQVIEAEHFVTPPNVDGCFTGISGMVVAILTADCLPLLLCDIDNRKIAAIHVGWRGLCGGIIDNALLHFTPESTLAWVGPCIGSASYEIDTPVREACLKLDASLAEHFTLSRPNHWWMNLAGMVTTILQKHGFNSVFHSGCCTYSDPEHWYSYRRDGVTGRMASLIWMNY